MITALISSTFRYGIWELSFKKTVQLPFTPTYGIMLVDCENTQEINLNLLGDKCKIYHTIGENHINVDIRERVTENTYEEYLDEVLEMYTKAGWERVDYTNIEAFKALLKRNSKN